MENHKKRQKVVGKSKTVGAHTLNRNLEKKIKKIIGIRDFSTISIIGQGSYAKVALVQKNDTKILYALKILQKKEVKLKH